MAQREHNKSRLDRSEWIANILRGSIAWLLSKFSLRHVGSVIALPSFFVSSENTQHTTPTSHPFSAPISPLTLSPLTPGYNDPPPSCAAAHVSRSSTFTTRHPATNSLGCALSGGSNAVLRCSTNTRPRPKLRSENRATRHPPRPAAAPEAAVPIVSTEAELVAVGSALALLVFVIDVSLATVTSTTISSPSPALPSSSMTSPAHGAAVSGAGEGFVTLPVPVTKTRSSRGLEVAPPPSALPLLSRQTSRILCRVPRTCDGGGGQRKLEFPVGVCEAGRRSKVDAINQKVNLQSWQGANE